MHARWSLSGCCSFAFCHTDGISDSAFAKTIWLPDLEVWDGGLWDWKRGLHDLGDGLGGVCEEREGCEPDIMAFRRGGCEFESACRSQDQDGAVEEGTGAFGRWIVILYIQYGLDGHCQRQLSSFISRQRSLRFRPDFPIKADPEVGCLLLHITALS
jgi:hypothetical protein